MDIAPISLTALASPQTQIASGPKKPPTTSDATAFADQLASAAAPRRAPAVTQPPSVFEQLETMLVQQMLQTMLSSEEGGFFGEGLGSDYYASFMAEHFGAALSGSLDLGIAEQLEDRFDQRSR